MTHKVFALVFGLLFTMPYALRADKGHEIELIEASPDPSEARLSQILLDGEELEFFNQDSFSYIVNLPYTTTILPVVSAVAVNSSANWRAILTAARLMSRQWSDSP